MKQILIVVFLLSVLIISGCVQSQAPQPAQQPQPAKPNQPTLQPEPEPLVDSPIEDLTKRQIEPQIQELFDKAEEKTQSLSFTYVGPEMGKDYYEVLVKESLMRINMPLQARSVDTYQDAYNAIYLDTQAKTAEAYCDAQTCIARGKKRSLSYNEVLILTPLEWAEKITQAQKLSEEKVDNRKSWKIKTDLGEIYVDSYTGIIQRIITSDGEYQFTRIEQNAVKDEDLRPEI